MCFAGVNFGPNVPQSNQERLNRIDAIPPASSRAIRPANFVLTLPMITQIDREIDPDRDFGLVTFGIDLKHSIQDDHVLPSSEAKGWNRTSCNAITKSKGRLLPTSLTPRPSTDSTVLLI